MPDAGDMRKILSEAFIKAPKGVQLVKGAGGRMGFWRTIGGRKVFLVPGDRIEDALKQAKRGGKGKLTPDEHAAMATRYHAGEKLQSIADDYGISPVSALLIAKGYGVKLRSSARPDMKDRDSEIAKKVQDGMTLRSIADEYGMSHVNVAHIARMQGVVRPRRSDSKMTPEDIKTVTERHNNGESLSDIAKEMGTSRAYVRRLLVYSGVEVKDARGRVTPEMEREIVRRLQGNETMQSIAESLGIHWQTVGRYRAKHGITSDGRKTRWERNADRNREIAKKVQDGMTLRSVAEEYGMTSPNVANIAKAHGVSARQRGRATNAKPRPKKSSNPIAGEYSRFVITTDNGSHQLYGFDADEVVARYRRLPNAGKVLNVEKMRQRSMPSYEPTPSELEGWSDQELASAYGEEPAGSKLKQALHAEMGRRLPDGGKSSRALRGDQDPSAKKAQDVLRSQDRMISTGAGVKQPKFKWRFERSNNSGHRPGDAYFGYTEGISVFVTRRPLGGWEAKVWGTQSSGIASTKNKAADAAVAAHMANNIQEAGAMHGKKDGKCGCWDGYDRVPGTKPCAPGSCEKCDHMRKTNRLKDDVTESLTEGVIRAPKGEKMVKGPGGGMGFWRNIRGHSVFMVPGQSFSATIDKYEAEHGKLPGPLRQAHAKAATGRYGSQESLRRMRERLPMDSRIRKALQGRQASMLSPNAAGPANTRPSVRKAPRPERLADRPSEKFNAEFDKFSKDWHSDPQSANFPALVAAAKKDGTEAALHHVIAFMAGVSYPAHAAGTERARMAGLQKDFKKFLDDPATVAAAERLAAETGMGSKRIEWDDEESYKRVRAAYEAAGGKHAGDDEALFTAMDGNRNFWEARQGQSPVRSISNIRRQMSSANRRKMLRARGESASMMSPSQKLPPGHPLRKLTPEQMAYFRNRLGKPPRTMRKEPNYLPRPSKERIDVHTWADKAGDFGKRLRKDFTNKQLSDLVLNDPRAERAFVLMQASRVSAENTIAELVDIGVPEAQAKRMVKDITPGAAARTLHSIASQHDFTKRMMQESNVQPYMGGHIGDHGKQAERLMRNQWPTGNAVKGTKSPHGFGEPSSSMEMLKKHMSDRFRNMSTTTGRPGAFKDGVKPQGGTAETATGMKPGGTANPDWLKGE